MEYFSEYVSKDFWLNNCKLAIRGMTMLRNDSSKKTPKTKLQKTWLKFVETLQNDDLERNLALLFTKMYGVATWKELYQFPEPLEFMMKFDPENTFVLFSNSNDI